MPTITFDVPEGTLSAGRGASARTGHKAPQRQLSAVATALNARARFTPDSSVS